MKLLPPYVVLDYFRWADGRRWAHLIGADLIALTRKWGFKPLKDDDIQRNEYAAFTSYKDHAEVRMTAVPQSEGTGWHQDGDTTVGGAYPGGRMDFGLILWSNRDPTEFKCPDGRVCQPMPFYIVYAHNLACVHRRPPGLSGRRWHFRQRVEKWNSP